MLKKGFLIVNLILVMALLISGSAFGRASLEYSAKERGSNFALQNPADCQALHNVGEFVLSVNNNGTFGDGFGIGPAQDCFTGEPIPDGGSEYPKNSGTQYLFAASFWVGAVQGRDTLVSTGADGWLGIQEFFPDESPFGDMVRRSITDPNSPEFDGAISEQDYIATYTDTFITLAGTDPDDGNRAHRPLFIEVKQESYAWSYSYAEDLILFDYKIKNIGNRTLNNAFMGVYVDADVLLQGANSGFENDICGFKPTYEFAYANNECTYLDTIYIAWIADSEGGSNPNNPSGDFATPNVTATRIVRTPAQELDVSFNWWVSNGNAQLDFGPRHRGSLQNPFRDFGTGGTGTPIRDANRYHVLSNKEFDYDQIYTATIQPTDSVWLYPTQALAVDLSNGFDTRYLLSFGPFNIDPGQTLPLSFSYLAGEDFHTFTDNIDNLQVGSYNPQLYYDSLHFEDLAENARWASWIYDNPGVDSDGDGYFGELVECVLESIMVDSVISQIIGTEPPLDTIWSYTWDSTAIETLWIKGDNIPDFEGASPPPAPDFWLEPEKGKIRVRFNGFRSETARDVFSREVDFEGYRIYLAFDERSESYSVVTSYDRFDFNKYIFNGRDWVLRDAPFTLEQLQALYTDPPIGDPLNYSRTNPYSGPNGEIFYFEKQDFNASELGVEKSMRKIYPDQPYPSSIDPDSAKPDELTADGYFKYFEYEYYIQDQLPFVQVWVNVTAFDYGSPGKGLAALESSRTLNAQSTYPLPTSADVSANNLEVFVYPNPYRLDAGYRDMGLEGRNSPIANPPDDRVRAIHFANLPPKCTISIFSLDGDLVREIDHDINPNDPNSSHETWDLITRNTQLVVSGLYYWTVEDEDGKVQVGKFAIVL